MCGANSSDKVCVRVGAGGWRTACACARRDVDDRTTAGHVFGRGHAALKRAREVELELGSKDFIWCIHQRTSGLFVGSADVVDPDIKPTEFGHGALRYDIGEIADIAVDDECSAAAFTHANCSHFKVVDTPRIQHEITAEVGEPPRDRSADALAGTSDHRHTVGHLEHFSQSHVRETNSAISFSQDG